MARMKMHRADAYKSARWPTKIICYAHSFAWSRTVDGSGLLDDRASNCQDLWISQGPALFLPVRFGVACYKAVPSGRSLDSLASNERALVRSELEQATAEFRAAGGTY